MRDFEWNMNLALEQAELAFKMGEVPVGAVITDAENKIIASAHNLKESKFDSTGHAEIIAIKEASKNLNNWRLENCTLYVTLEPCLMCLNALIHARLKHVVFGAYDKKGGALSLGYYSYKDKRLNHNFNIYGGIKHYQCSTMLSNFFKQRRKSYK